jgi:hypothetical protein
MQLHRVLNTSHERRYSKTLINIQKDRKTYTTGKRGVFPHSNAHMSSGVLIYQEASKNYALIILQFVTFVRK